MRPLAGALISCILGLIGGPLVAWPVPIMGLVLGPILAVPIGLVSGIICAAMDWPMRVVYSACLGQFIGALVLGYAFFLSAGDYPSSYAFEGQVIGAAVGLWVGLSQARKSKES